MFNIAQTQGAAPSNLEPVAAFDVDADGRIDSAGQRTMSLAYDGAVVKAQGNLGVQTANGEWVSPGCAGTWKGRRSSSPASAR